MSVKGHIEQKTHRVKVSYVVFLFLICNFLLNFASTILNTLYTKHYISKTVREFFSFNGGAWLGFCIYFISAILILALFGKALLQHAKSFVKTPRRLRAKNIGITALIAVLSTLAESVVYSILLTFGVSFENQASLEVTVSQSRGVYAAIRIISMVLLGPFVEEVIYRFGFLEVFKRKKWALYCVVSSLLFGLSHVWAYVILNHDWKQFLAAIPYAVGSVGFCFVYKETENICYPFLLHMFVNMLAFRR